ncbi:hypothetical protein BDR06DRAFT_946550 [Suillus hirtellus]|nr:hypothetical protein BDR06DRAFT_946550 [Suillus hirtellus]
MRLPSYRSSHMLRYHPYPRFGLSQRELLAHTTEENDPLLINNPLSGHNVQNEDTSNALDLARISLHLLIALLTLQAQPGNEEQEENAPNPPEVVEVLEGELRDRHRKLTALLIVILLFVVRKLTVTAQ